MNAVLTVLSLQALLGAFDNLWHHEWQARLPQRSSAVRELRLHALREGGYALLFLGLAWWRWQGWCALLLALLLAAEVSVTLLDFLEEDRSRQLPPLERLLHTVLALGYGVFLALFAPLLWQWAQQPTGWAWAPQGAWAGWFTLMAVVVAAWGLRNARAAQRLAAQADGALPTTLPPGPAWLVTGGTGFIGSALVRQQVAAGRRVIVWSRDARQARAQLGPGVWVVQRLDEIPAETEIEAVVALAGATVLGPPWTARRRRLLHDSRVHTLQAVLGLVQRLQRRPAVLVAASAVGWYGVPEDAEAELDETGPARPGQFASELCQAVETAAGQAAALGLRVVCLRLGIVLGRGGGAYPPQALAARLGLGAVLGSGRQWLPWVHLDDVLGLIRFAVGTPALVGPVNVVAPDLPRQADFVRALARSFGRPAWLWAPALALRLPMGEMAELLLQGARVKPAAALRAGYVFRHPDLAPALAGLATAR